jgi:hypothetical protein
MSHGKCPSCNERGRPVSTRTVNGILKEPLRHALPPTDLFFCRSQECHVLYFGPDYWCVDHGAARIRVGVKDASDTAVVCYCFDVTRGAIRQELRREGHPNVVDRITREIQGGNCACETRNPTGRCCLGHVRQVTALIEAQTAGR